MGSKKERKKSTKTKGGKVEVMASFGIFLHLAILCFFIKSKVHGKHFLIATKGDVGHGDSGDYSSSSSCGSAVGIGSGLVRAKVRCVCHCNSLSEMGGFESPTAIAIAECECVCNGERGKYGKCEEVDPSSVESSEEDRGWEGWLG